MAIGNFLRKTFTKERPTTLTNDVRKVPEVSSTAVDETSSTSISTTFNVLKTKKLGEKKPIGITKKIKNKFSFLELRTMVVPEEIAEENSQKIDKIRKNLFSGIEPIANYKVEGSVPKKIPDFERKQKNFITDEPEILFVSEYIVDNKFIGILIAWEHYRDSTHYEILKKNVFKSESDFERILFLDKKNLEDETKNYLDYVKNTLGFNEIDSKKIYIILDDVVKVDRIYEYKIVGAKVPREANQVDYDLILESKNQLSKHALNSSIKLSDLGRNFYKDERMSWLIALMNEKIPFFGENVAKNSIGFILGGSLNEEKEVFVANNIQFVQDILIDSISLFGIKETYKFLLTALGGLPQIFIDAFVESIDEEKNIFSLTKFKDVIKKQVPIFELILDVVEGAIQANLEDQLPPTLPTEFGTRSLLIIKHITESLSFLNKTYISILISQDKESLRELKELEKELEEEKFKRATQKVIQETRIELESIFPGLFTTKKEEREKREREKKFDIFRR
jgi:hypothetical protein